jgi:ABC-2 type transport system permease protein
MSGYIAFVKKEFMENTRNYRLLIMASVFVVLGMLAPLSARFLAEILSALAPDYRSP